MTVIDTPAGIARFQMLVVRQGLRACKLGGRLNRAYTPTNLRNMVARVTGEKFSIRDFDGMIAAMDKAIAASE